MNFIHFSSLSLFQIYLQFTIIFKKKKSLKVYILKIILIANITKLLYQKKTIDTNNTIFITAFLIT